MPPALHRSVVEWRYVSLIRSWSDMRWPAPCSGKSTTGSWNTIAPRGSRRSRRWTNAASARHAASFARRIGEQRAGRLVEHADDEHDREHRVPERACGGSGSRRRRDTRTRSSSAGEHRDTGERDHDRDPVPRAHALEPDELHHPRQAAGRRRRGTRSASRCRAGSRAASRPAPVGPAARARRAPIADARTRSRRPGRGWPCRGRCGPTCGELVGDPGERAEAVAGDRAQQLHEPQRVPLAHRRADGRGRRGCSPRAASGTGSSGGSRAPTSRARRRR